MASDFYSILKGSIDSRALKTSVERREVYDQARRAMIRKLWSNEPPLGEDEIAKRIGFFDAAVERIEGDFEPDPEPAAESAASPRDGHVYEGYDEAADYATGLDARERATPPMPVEATMPPPRPEPKKYDRAPEPDPAEHGEDEPIPSIFRRSDLPEAPPPAPAEYEPGHEGFGQLEEGFEGYRRRVPSLNLSLRLPSRERDRVRLLAAVIACLTVGLVAILVFALYPRDREVSAAAGAAVAPVTTTQVSDAATAAEIPKRAIDVVRSYTVFDGNDPTVFVGTPDNPIRFDRDKDGAFTRVSSSADAAGARAVIGPGLAGSLAGKDVRVVMSVRASREGGAASLRFAYQSGVAVSHWQVARAGTTYDDIGLIWRLPAQRTDPSGDYLLIEPGIPGDGTSVDIRSIRIDVLGRS